MAELRYNISAAVVAETEGSSYVFKVDGYSSAKWKLRNGEPLVSKLFSVGGYDWAVEYYPNGGRYEYSDYISVYLVLHSDSAKDVNAIFTFSVLDRNGHPVSKYSRTIIGHTFSKKGSSGGYHDFIDRGDLERALYVRDDNFSIRCDVSVVVKDNDQQKCNQSVVVVVPPSDLLRHLEGLLKNMDGADVIFRVGGEEFSAHRAVLAARSTVFKAELFGAMKEKECGLVEVCDMEADIFKSLLHYLYTDSLPGDRTCGDGTIGDVVMAGHLLVAADRYNVERLKLICEHKLCRHVDSKMVATSLALAEQHSCQGLKEVCLQFLDSPSNVEAMMASDGYEHLKSSCPSVLKELVARFLPAQLKAVLMSI